MNNSLFVIGFLFLLFSCSGGGNNSDVIQVTDTIVIDSALISLPEAIRDLPVGIEVLQEPDSLRAEKWDKDSSFYVWKHSTLIRSLKGDLKILEFATCNYKNGNWVLGNINEKLYGPDELNKWYIKKTDDIITWDHPIEGVIEAGVQYIDPSNYSIRNKKLVSREGLWYFIGVDTSGTKYMGYGRYVALPELKKGH
ncbi:MAG: hypothetical protein CVU05_03315 [Bacteroidetes bacterium HGW-Bacteroidetes-21]|jgi:hypothetical protein|nr:MAG: hypothetical protein CVU05_03315 [Bacteroidetes bacterium HGW-Bacteroidetes-21]